MAIPIQAAKTGLGFLGKAVGGIRNVVTGMRAGGNAARTVPSVITPATTTAKNVEGFLLRPRTASIFRRPTPPDLSKYTKLTPRPEVSKIGELVTRGQTAAPRSRSKILDDLANTIQKADPEYAASLRPVIEGTKTALKSRNLTAQEKSAEFAKTLTDVQTGASTRLVQRVPDETAAKLAKEAYDTTVARRAAIDTGLKYTGNGLAIGAGIAPTFIEEENLNPYLRTALGFATALPSSALFARGAGNLFRAGRYGPDVSTAVKFGRGAGDAARMAFGGLGTYLGAELVGGGTPAAAEGQDVTETPIIPQPGTTPGTGETVDPMQAAIDNINAQAEAQLQAVDAAVGSALDELIAAYGGDAYFQQALAENDQMLAMELAAIEADANAARSQIAANYDGAIAQIEGYTAQAGDVLSQAAAEQQAALETAAGGLQGATVPAGMGAAEAAAAGISGTAVGGAGITGAAMLRTQGAAGASQAAADKARVITSLSDQAATGRLNQADMMSALERGVIDAQQAARIDSANRKSKIREAQNQAKLDVAKIKYETEAQAAQSKAEIEATKLANELALRETYAQLTPEQRAAFTGSAAPKRKLPSWAVEQAGDQDANVAKAGSSLKVPLRDRNEIVSILTAYAVAPENPSDPAGALAYWVSILQSLQKTDPAISRKLEALGLPFTAPQLAAEFSTTK